MARLHIALLKGGAGLMRLTGIPGGSSSGAIVPNWLMGALEGLGDLYEKVTGGNFQALFQWNRPGPVGVLKPNTSGGGGFVPTDLPKGTKFDPKGGVAFLPSPAANPAAILYGFWSMSGKPYSNQDKPKPPDERESPSEVIRR